MSLKAVVRAVSTVAVGLAGEVRRCETGHTCTQTNVMLVAMSFLGSAGFLECAEVV